MKPSLKIIIAAFILPYLFTHFIYAAFEDEKTAVLNIIKKTGLEEKFKQITQLREKEFKTSPLLDPELASINQKIKNREFLLCNEFVNKHKDILNTRINTFAKASIKFSSTMNQEQKKQVVELAEQLEKMEQPLYEQIEKDLEMKKLQELREATQQKILPKTKSKFREDKQQLLDHYKLVNEILALEEAFISMLFKNSTNKDELTEQLLNLKIKFDICHTGSPQDQTLVAIVNKATQDIGHKVEAAIKSAYEEKIKQEASK